MKYSVVGQSFDICFHLVLQICARLFEIIYCGQALLRCGGVQLCAGRAGEWQLLMVFEDTAIRFAKEVCPLYKGSVLCRDSGSKGLLSI